MPNPDEVPNEQTPQVQKVGIKVPPFWPEKPELWFCQLEAQFNICGVTQDVTKFWHVVSQLDNTYAKEVDDLIRFPPEHGKYAKIKAELIQRLSSSEQQLLMQLLEHEEIGDRTPSQFLRHLKTLAGGSVQETFLKTLWLSRLPTVMRPILATQESLSLDKIADVADKVHEAGTRTTHQVASVAQPLEIATLAEQVKKLTAQIEEMSQSPQRRYARSRSKNRSCTNQRPEDTQEDSEKQKCWYHFKFGQAARKCRTPCSQSSKNGTARH